MKNDNIDHNLTRQDIDKYITKLTNTITDTLNDNVKTKTVTHNKIGLTNHILKMIKGKKILWKTMEKNTLKIIKHYTIPLITT